MEPYLLLTKKTNKKGEVIRDSHGLVVCLLTLVHKDFQNKFVEVNTGHPDHQVFRRHDDSQAKPGSMEPIPEGKYRISLPIYRQPGEHWPEGIGDRTMPLTPLLPLIGGRGAFEVHPDANRLWAPGSAGCPATLTTEDWNRVAYWRKELGADTLIADWRLGTFKDKYAAEPQVQPVVSCSPKIYLRGDAARLVVPTDLPAGNYDIATPAQGWPVHLSNHS